MQIRVDDLRSAAVADLLRAHLENSKLWSPPQSIHALDVGALRAPEETGSMAAYAAARALYTRFGFSVCGPFADYVADTNSVFMTRQLGCQATPNPGVHQQRGEPDSR